MSRLKQLHLHHTDAEYIDAIVHADDAVIHDLYVECRRYWLRTYRKVLATGDVDESEAFQESFVTLWEKIERGSIRLADGVIIADKGKPLRCRLTTYMMSIACNKYKEYARDDAMLDHNVCLDTLDGSLYDDRPDGDVRLDIISDCLSHMSERCRQILTLAYYEQASLDDMLARLPSFASRDALKTAKHKCLNNLRTAANNIYERIKTRTQL